MTAVHPVNPNGYIPSSILDSVLPDTDHNFQGSGITYVFNSFFYLCEVVFAIKYYRCAVRYEVDIGAGDPALETYMRISSFILFLPLLFDMTSLSS